MKTNIAKLVTILGIVACTVLSSKAAVTLNFATQTGSANGPNGFVIVNSAGAAIPNSSGSLFASIGYLTPGGQNTAAGVLSSFVPSGLVLVPNLVSGVTPRDGLFNGQIYSNATNALPPGFEGKTAVVIIGNNSNISLSTAIAAFTFGTINTVDPVNGLVQSFALTSASVPTIGSIVNVTKQPIDGNTFVKGISLVQTSAIPEPSAILLGMSGVLGLLRRRRI